VISFAKRSVFRIGKAGPDVMKMNREFSFARIASTYTIVVSLPASKQP
jgi:hypothetical protein